MRRVTLVLHNYIFMMFTKSNDQLSRERIEIYLSTFVISLNLGDIITVAYRVTIFC